jgi:hypothetical protein
LFARRGPTRRRRSPCGEEFVDVVAQNICCLFILIVTIVFLEFGFRPCKSALEPVSLGCFALSLGLRLRLRSRAFKSPFHRPVGE